MAEKQQDVKTPPRWVRLDQAGRETGVLVAADNEDRFALAMQLAIRGRKTGSRMDKADRQVKELLQKLFEWVRVHGRDIEQAYAAVRDQRFLFLVVPKEKRFNPPFEDELTKLDMEVAEDTDFDLVPFSVLSLPCPDEGAVFSFLASG